MQNVPYRAKIKLVEWEENLDRFRGHSVNGEIENESAVSVLFSTDLASRAWMPLVALPLFSYSLLGMWLLICIVCCGRAGNRWPRCCIKSGNWLKLSETPSFNKNA